MSPSGARTAQGTGIAPCYTSRMLLLPVIALLLSLLTPSQPPYGQSGWEGYSVPGTTRVSVDFTVPNLHGARGDSVAFWAGFGKGDPGIQQAGITGTVGSGWTAWWELWPAAGHPFSTPVPPHSGDVMQFIVTRSASVYTLRVNDVTRHWSASISQSDGNRETSGEAVAEAYGPALPDYGPARFTYASAPLGGVFRFPFGGSRLVKTGSESFYDVRP